MQTTSAPTNIVRETDSDLTIREGANLRGRDRFPQLAGQLRCQRGMSVTGNYLK